MAGENSIYTDYNEMKSFIINTIRPNGTYSITGKDVQSVLVAVTLFVRNIEQKILDRQ